LSASEHHMTRGRRSDASWAFGEAFSRAKRRTALATTRVGRSDIPATSGGLLAWLFK
jgi:hypothetical protein